MALTRHCTSGLLTGALASIGPGSMWWPTLGYVRWASSTLSAGPCARGVGMVGSFWGSIGSGFAVFCVGGLGQKSLRSACSGHKSILLLWRLLGASVAVRLRS
jgi:hypothetical protein